MSEQLVVFCYDGIVPVEVAVLRAQADRIRKLERSITASAIEIGRELVSIKSRLQHGQFGPWVKSECGFDIRSAERYIALARAVEDDEPKATALSLLPLTLAHELVSKSAPPELVDEVLDCAAKGEAIEAADVAARLAKSRQPSKVKTAKTMTVTAPAEVGKKVSTVPTEATRLIGIVKLFAAFCQTTDPQIVSAGALPEEILALRADVPVIFDWLKQLALHADKKGNEKLLLAPHETRQ
jgi:hypothetical protein